MAREVDIHSVGTEPADLRRAILDLWNEFDAHNHDGNNSRSFDSLVAETFRSRVSINGTPGSTRSEISSVILKFYGSANLKTLQLSANGLQFYRTATGVPGTSFIYSDGFGLVLQDDDSSSPFYLNSDTQVLRKFEPYIDANTIDIGATTSGHRFRTIYLINSPDVSSSREGKQKIKAIEYGLEHVLRMQPVSFSRMTRERKNLKVGEAATNEKVVEEKNLGFIAEDLHLIVPEVASPTSIKPDHMIPILVKAIQELAAKVDALEKAAISTGK